MIKEYESLFTIKNLSIKIKNGEITPTDLVNDCLEKIKKYNSKLNAFITVIENDAYKEAAIIEKDIKKGKYLGPLHGIPYSAKDIFYVNSIRCTVGSKILYNFIPKYDATVITKMKKAGAILIGKNTLDEFAFGIMGTNSHYSSSKNPWDQSRISGGSSGGSAVAVSMGMVYASLGTDTGGSLRAPSSLCGVIGLKPTFGLVSTHGVFPVSSSMDHVGWITRSVWDSAAILELLLEKTQFTNNFIKRKIPNYTEIIEELPIEKLSIGIPKNFFLDFLDPDVESLFYSFIDSLKSFDVNVTDVNLSNTDKYYEPNLNIARAEAAEIHLEWLKTRLHDYSEEMRKSFQYGLSISAVDYIRSKKNVKEIRNELLRLLKDKIDVIILPTTIITATKFEERQITIKGKQFSVNDALTRNNIIFNSTGLPSISMPSGLTKNKMPTGVQIIGAPFEESKILTLAYNYECKSNILDKMIPPLLLK